ncbi:restriction endonuclease subunit S [Methanocaldococcus sp.]
MEFYKETKFKNSEIGDVPEDWDVVRLGKYIKEFIRGVTYKKGEYSEIEKAGYIPLLRATNLQDKKIIFKDLVYIPINKVDFKQLIRKGDVLITTSSGSRNLVGRAIYVNQEIDKSITIGSFLAIIRFNNINDKFAYYLFESKFYRSYLNSLVGGTNINNLKKEHIFNFIIPLPPLEEQKAIAEILSKTDEAIQKVDESIEKFEKLKKGLMNILLNGKVRAKVENGKIYFYKETKFKNSEIGEVPEDWVVVRLGDIAEKMYYGITAKAVDYDTGLKMVRTTDIINYKVDWENLPFCEITDNRKDFSKYLIKKDDILISRAGTVGISVLSERDYNNVIFGSYLIKLQLKPKAFPKYVHYFLQSEHYWKHIGKAQGSTLKNINLPLLKSLIIPLPPIEEQKAIAEILSKIDKVIQLKKEKKEKLQKIKKYFMDNLLTGKVRIKQ